MYKSCKYARNNFKFLNESLLDFFFYIIWDSFDLIHNIVFFWFIIICRLVQPLQQKNKNFCNL